LTKAPASSGVLGVDAYRAEPWLADLQANWVRQNVALINSVPADQLADMEQIVQRGVMNGSASSVIKLQIMDRYSVSENNAKRIAIDQIGKANAALLATILEQVVGPINREADGTMAHLST